MRHIKTVAIIGAGAWGTAIAKSIAETRPHVSVRVWAFEKSVVTSINNISENEFLPGIKLPRNIKAYFNLREAVDEAEVVILAPPSKFLYEIAQRLARFITDETLVGYLTKGFCKVQEEILTISQAIEKAVPQLTDKVVAISGPSHAEEVSQGFHTCLNVGSKSPESRAVIADLLTTDYLQCRETDDILGVEIGGTLKNPAAIAAGMISVLPRCGDNLSGTLISESLKEMIRLGGIFGISKESMIDISGLGDLVATALSGHSRNRRFGRDISNQIMHKGRTLGLFDKLALRLRPKSVVERMSKKFNYLAEGAYAIEPLIELAESANISIPIYRSLYEVLLNKKDISLLIETIKNPARFNELYYSTKIHLMNRKNGLEKVNGQVFSGLVIGRIMEKFTTRQGPDTGGYSADELIQSLREFYSNETGPRGGGGPREMRIMNKLSGETFAESIRQLATLYFNSITDKYNSVFKWLFLLYTVIIQVSNLILLKRFKTFSSGQLKEIKKIKNSVNIIYAAESAGMMDFISIIISISRRGLPFPRFMIQAGAFDAWHAFILKQLGGFMVDANMLHNPLYRETLRQYLSTLAGHGVPILYFPFFPREEHSNTSENEFFSAITESLFRHTTEIALVPVEISYQTMPHGPQSGRIPLKSIMSNRVHVNYSKPVYLSEFADKPFLGTGLAGAVKNIWNTDKKIFPHYILSKILSVNNYDIELDSALKFVKQYMSDAGRRFDYTPARILRKGTDFLVRNGAAVVSDGHIIAKNRDDLEYYAGMIG